MSRGAKVGFFILSVVVMSLLAGGAVLMDVHLSEGLISCGVGLLLAGVGFAVKGRLMHDSRTQGRHGGYQTNDLRHR